MRLRLLAIALIFLSVFLLQLLLNFFFKPLLIANQDHFFLKPGSSSQMVARELHHAGFIPHPFLFQLMLRIEGKSHELKSGEYLLRSGMSAQQILNKLVRGDYIAYELTIPEGWTLEKIRSALKENTHITHLTDDLSEAELKKTLGISEESLEGLFFPDTYVFSAGTSDQELLEQAYHRMQTVLPPSQNAYEGLIIASLVEAEAKLDSERPLIAGVIVARLQKQMPLQIDSTIIYALGKNYTGHLSRADLRFDSPYNTYLHKGLPPSPINSPGLVSIQAAFHPVITDNLYYVARGDGSHAFSSTLSAHNRAVRQYLLMRK